MIHPQQPSGVGAHPQVRIAVLEQGENLQAPQGRGNALGGQSAPSQCAIPLSVPIQSAPPSSGSTQLIFSSGSPFVMGTVAPFADERPAPACPARYCLRWSVRSRHLRPRRPARVGDHSNLFRR